MTILKKAKPRLYYKYEDSLYRCELNGFVCFGETAKLAYTRLMELFDCMKYASAS